MKLLRVLVIEDDALLGYVLGQVLEELGYEVVAIEATQAGAVAAAATTKPDLMIVDVHLRSGGGMAAVSEICAARFVPHVFVTGDIAATKAKRPGAVAIQKPYVEADLARAIGEALAVKREEAFPARLP